MEGLMKRCLCVLACLVPVVGWRLLAQPGTPAKMVIAQKARALPLGDVRLNGGSLDRRSLELSTRRNGARRLSWPERSRRLPA
jgi:hypothetical protein